MSKDTAPNSWYVSGPYGVRGPMDEVQLRKYLEDPKTLQVKQGFSTWYPVSIVREKFAKLDQEGIYINRENVVEGPYTLQRAYDLLTSDTNATTQVKTTVSGEWVSVDVWLDTIRRMQAAR